jgi:hypothetical protein
VISEAQLLAKQGNIARFGGRVVPGQEVGVRREFTDANCYLGYRTHACDHAFGAKLCVAAGSSLVLLSDHQGMVDVVLTGKNAIRFPKDVFDQVGVPGVAVVGRLVEYGRSRWIASIVRSCMRESEEEKLEEKP